MTKYFSINILLIMTALFILIKCAETPPDDVILPWDTDGDGISNCVETNNTNNHHNFDPDQPNDNPSLALGLPYNGTLAGGINICDENTGYYHFYGTDPVDHDDWGTLDLIQCIEATGRRWDEDYNFRFGFGDMSLQNGGSFPPHASHQNGLDMDMRYIRTDGQQLPLDISTQSSLYDVEATVNLMNFLIQESSITVTDIFVDTNYAQIVNQTGNILQHASGHTNHFHVRIQDPDGLNN